MNRRRLFAALQASVTIALLTLLFRQFDWPAFLRLWQRIPWPFYVLSLATVLAGQLLYAWRWHITLAALAVRVPFAVTLRHSLVGVFFNNFLPSAIGGDSAKVYYLGREEGYVRATASVLIDRAIGVFFVATLALLLVVRSADVAPGVAVARAVLLAIWFGVATALLAIAWVPVGRPLSRASRRWPRLQPLAERATSLTDHMARAVRRPMVLVASGAVVSTYFLLLGLIYREFIRAATGIEQPLLPVTGMVALIATLSNVPVAVNGLGLREQLHLMLLGVFGLTPEAAAGISLLLFAHLLAVSAIGAMFWLRTPAISRGEAVS